MANPDRTDNHALLAALKHPLRRKILRAMADEEPVSPKELAERLDQPLPNLSYHVRVLAKCDAVKLVEEKKVSGAKQRLYRWSLEPAWARNVLEEPEEDPAGGKA